MIATATFPSEFSIATTFWSCHLDNRIHVHELIDADFFGAKVSLLHV